MTRKIKGFTLVEVMVAVAIFSLILVAVTASFSSLGRSYTRVNDSSYQLSEIRGVTGFIRSRIENAIPVGWVRPGVGRGTYFYGEENWVVWVAPFELGLDMGGLHIFRLSHNAGSIWLQLQPYDASVEEVEWGEIEAYQLMAADSLEIGYKDFTDSEWQEIWEFSQKNPGLVKVLIKADKYLPEMVMRLNDGNII